MSSSRAEAAFKTPSWQSEPAQRLKGKVALVTGAGSGIGQGCALLFARQGAHVFASDINEPAVQVTAAQAEAAGFPLAGVARVDLTQQAQVRQWVAGAKASAGGIDILVNAGADATWGLIEDISLADFRYTMELEVDIVFIACQAVWPVMKQRGGGSIINFASTMAHQAQAGTPGLSQSGHGRCAARHPRQFDCTGTDRHHDDAPCPRRPRTRRAVAPESHDRAPRSAGGHCVGGALPRVG